MRFTFFKTGKPREFKYIPRFYDEKKEAAEERKKEIERELGVTHNEAFKTVLGRGSISRKFAESKRNSKSSNIRLIIIIVVLFLLVYYLFSK